MSLKNGTKTQTFVAKCTLANDYVITLAAELVQTCVKKTVKLEIVDETPGGKVLNVHDVIVAEMFDNQPGIRKELYMGWAVCYPEDVPSYDLNYGVDLARRHFSRPLVTYNFTYLNKDQVECLMKNELEYVVNKHFSDTYIKNMEIFSI